MRLLRLLVAALLFASLGSLARPAQAQLAIGTPDWNNRSQENRKVDEISLQDCLDDADITFTTTFPNVTSGSFELWAGAGCTDSTKRTNNDGCVQVGEGSISSMQVTVRVQNLVKDYKDAAEGTAETCSTNSGEGLLARTLFFFVIDGSDMVTAQGLAWPYKYDIVPPPPPTEIKAGSGESSLVVDFTAPSESNLDSYRFYCAPAEGDCTASALVPEMLPDETTFCGTTEAQGSASGATDSKLQDNTLYAVGVSTTDNVGNVGVLSSLACATPQEVTGFFEAYRSAGGQGGGGFCSFAPARRGAPGFAGALLLGALALWRRRR